MHVPAVLFGFLIASLLGSAFHLWRGGGPGKLLLDIVLSWIGFWGGHAISNQMGWTFLSLGPLRIGTAIPGSLILVFLGNWLSLENTDNQKNKKTAP